MASSLINVCRFNPTAGGTTDWTYSSAVTGYQSPSAAGAVNSATYSYRAESADLTQWEIGTGAYNSGTGVFARTAVLFNSAGTTSKINFSAVPQVAIVALAEDLVRSIGGNAGAFTLGSGLTNSGNDLQAAAGVSLRTLQTVDTTNRSISSTSFSGSGVISPSLSPASSSNKVLVQVSGLVGASAAQGGFFTLYRSIGGGAYGAITPVGVTEMQGFVITDANSSQSLSFALLDSPATTSAVIYQLYFRSNAGATIYLGRRGADALFNSPTVITVTEIKG